MKKQSTQKSKGKKHKRPPARRRPPKTPDSLDLEWQHQILNDRRVAIYHAGRLFNRINWELTQAWLLARSAPLCRAVSQFESLIIAARRIESLPGQAVQSLQALDIAGDFNSYAGNEARLESCIPTEPLELIPGRSAPKNC